MVKFGPLSNILDHALVYRLWEAPFAKAKLGPLLKRGEIQFARRVLDVGCGPGTNTRYFKHADYVGLDLNERYIEYASRRYQGEFIVTDVTTYEPPDDIRFDFILLNSFLHHIDDDNVRRILTRLSKALTENGHIHIVDLLLPRQACVAHWLTKHDRGHFPRPLEDLRGIFSDICEPVVIEPFELRCCGMVLWNMIYFKGRLKHEHRGRSVDCDSALQ